MANNHTNFTTFNDNIRLTDAKRRSLKKSRKEIRNKIRKYWNDNFPNESQPKFQGQGSLPMDTITNPIPRKEIENGIEKTKYYYDIDDGVYFEGDEELEKRILPATYHSRVYNAVNGHTDNEPVDKNTCVRTLFADGHNIDNPIYYKKGDIPELAHKRDGYIESDPLAFTNWFNEQADVNPQIRRLVRYGKAYIDYKMFCNKNLIMPSGMIISILIANNYVKRDRDDIAFKETMQEVLRVLRKEFICERPTTPKGENLLEGYTQKENFLNNLDNLVEDAKKALQEINFKKASEYWRNHFGDRFPLGEDKNDESNESFGLKTIIPTTTKPYAS